MHEVCAFLILVASAKPIRHPGRYNCHPIQRLVPLHRILDILAGGRFQRLLITIFQRIKRPNFGIAIPRKQSRIIRSLVMVRTPSNGWVQAIDAIGARNGAFVEVVRAVGFAAVATDNIKGLVRGVARVALLERAYTSRAARIG